MEFFDEFNYGLHINFSLFRFQNDGLKMLFEFLEDLDSQLEKLVEAKSVHDCLLSPLRLTNSLSQDYFLLLGRLSDTDAGLLMLEKCGILKK